MNAQTQTKEKTSKGSFLIRILTLPPLMAAFALCIMRVRKGFFPGSSIWAALFFLAVLPLMAYPFCYSVPALRKQGRPVQRKVAVLFSIVGYLGGTLYCLVHGLTGVEFMMFLTYLVSGLWIGVMSGCFHFKCSGHASGMAGPITLLGMHVSPVCFLGYGLLAPVFSSSLKLKRHTRQELVAGALTPAVLLILFTCMM